MSARYALYYAPAPGEAWAEFGAHWLGRCAATGRSLALPHVEGMPALEFARLTAAPRRYGFHATLKAPFRLVPGATPATLCAAVGDLAAGHAAFTLPPLRVVLLDDFLALVPAAADPRLDAIAADCVTAPDHLRAPLQPADLARRRAAGLDAREDELLQRWGYPWVLEQFRFHLSLSGALPDADRRHLAALTAAAQARLPADPPRFDAVCVFEETGPDADFRMIERIPLQS